jgi:hypothetical protein
MHGSTMADGERKEAPGPADSQKLNGILTAKMNCAGANNRINRISLAREKDGWLTILD